MVSKKVLRKKDYPRATWKNGLGHTDEIAIYPPGAELKKADFLWRVSSARIENAAPFSIFPAHDRVLVVLEGNGLKLTHTFEEGNEDLVEVLPLSPYEFPGDVPSRCQLINGPITDLSVFVRKAETEALVEVIEVDDAYPWKPAGRWNFAFAAAGDFSEFARGDTLQVYLDEPLGEHEAIEIKSTGQAPGKLVLISLQG